MASVLLVNIYQTHIVSNMVIKMAKPLPTPVEMWLVVWDGAYEFVSGYDIYKMIQEAFNSKRAALF
jgi:hypothetical protein